MAASQEWDLDEAMHRVHESNMSKLGEDGKPIYRADGKVLKGPNYKEPTLTDLI
jgi:predicted HAD superfamily Cof-like phosphohydrolase